MALGAFSVAMVSRDIVFLSELPDVGLAVVLAYASGDVDHGGNATQSAHEFCQVIAVAHGDADVDGADFGVALFNIDALNSSIAGGNLRSHLGHDAFAPAHIDPQHGLKFIVHVGGPTCRRDFVWCPSANLIQIVAGLYMHDEPFAGRHMTDDMVAW